MPTVAEILKQSGMTDEQITALDAKVMEGFTQVVTSATQAQEAAEAAKRAQETKWTGEIAPALDKWANDEANLTAQLNYYKSLAEKAKTGGFLPGDEPFKPPIADPNNPAPVRGPDGKYVAGVPGAVPGSPQFVSNLQANVGKAVGSILDLSFKYQQLYGTPMPDLPTALIAEANAAHMPVVEFASKKYNFAGKEKEIADAARKKETDAAVQAAIAENDKKWAEKVGNNPDMRQAQSSQFSEISSAVKAGTRPDPLKMTEAERDRSTRAAIQKEVASSTVQ